MREQVMGRVLRMARLRRNLRQSDVAAAAGLDRSTVTRIERGQIGRFHLHVVQAHAAALDLRAELTLTGRGGEVPRLLDEEHAAIVESLAAALQGKGWICRPEVSFNEYGDRGRVDLLAHRGGAGALLIVEAKTELVDLQDLFGALDAKQRLARQLGRHEGWEVTHASVLLAVASTPANRSIVRAHPALFSGYACRGQELSAWLAGPDRAVRALTWVSAARAGRDRWLAGRHRVSRPAAGTPVSARHTTHGRSARAEDAARSNRLD